MVSIELLSSLLERPNLEEETVQMINKMMRDVLNSMSSPPVKPMELTPNILQEWLNGPKEGE